MDLAKDMSFSFSLFNKDLVHVLEDCKYIRIPFEISDVKEINYALTQCAEIFFQEKVNLEDIKKSIEYSTFVLDFTWEKMNTGHWKDVDLKWRNVYTFASLFKVLSLLLMPDESQKNVIKACDMGLLMGAPVMKNILSKIASKLSNNNIVDESRNFLPQKKKIKVSSFESVTIKNKVKEEHSIPKEIFYFEYVEKSCPVVLTDIISDWPALSYKPWSVSYILNKARYRTVPIEVGSKYTDDNWTQKLMTLEEFIVEYIYSGSDQSEVGYLAQHNLFNQIPELFEDIRVPHYISDQEVDINIWFGPGGTVSPLHYDPKNNLLAQVMGEKYIRLYLERETEYLYPKENTWLSNTSQVDVEKPDLDSFPSFSKASYSECILKPGQVLFIPPKCWHFVKSLSTSLSISFWW